MPDFSDAAVSELTALIEDAFAIIRSAESDARKLHRIEKRLAEVENSLGRRDLVPRRR